MLPHHSWFACQQDQYSHAETHAVHTLTRIHTHTQTHTRRATERERERERDTHTHTHTLTSDTHTMSLPPRAPGPWLYKLTNVSDWERKQRDIKNKKEAERKRRRLAEKLAEAAASHLVCNSALCPVRRHYGPNLSKNITASHKCPGLYLRFSNSRTKQPSIRTDCHPHPFMSERTQARLDLLASTLRRTKGKKEEGRGKEGGGK